MNARYILAAGAIIFWVLGTVRWRRDGTLGPAARTWLTIGSIFALVSLWLWVSL